MEYIVNVLEVIDEMTCGGISEDEAYATMAGLLDAYYAGEE